MATCYHIDSMTMSASKGAKFSSSVGAAVPISAVYTEDPLTGDQSCPGGINFTRTIDGGAPAGWKSLDPTEEDTTYTENYTPTVPGVHVISGVGLYRVNDTDGIPSQQYPSDNSITILVWDEQDKPTGSWTEGSTPDTPSPDWGEEEPPDDPTWTVATEPDPPSPDWAEGEKPAGGFTEVP